MRFSKRTGWNTEESDLARAHRLRRQAGLPIADLTASNPTRCGFSYPASLLQALGDPRALDYDPQPRGLLEAREAVCTYYLGHGVRIEPDQVVLTTSTSEAYSFLLRLLCDPGDEVVILQPGYPLFDFLADLCDVRLRAAPLVYSDGWQIDVEGVRREVTEKTRAIVVVHPNNPTGHFTKAWEAAELGKICRDSGLALIVDEVFLDYRDQGNLGTGEQEIRDWGNESFGSFAAGIDGVPVFVASGLSKIAGLPQMKAAWIVAAASGGDRAQKSPAQPQSLDRLEVIADTYLSMNAPVQWAMPAWLARRDEIQNQIRSRVAANLSNLDRQLAELPAVQRLAKEGGWYAVLRIPAVQPDEQTALELLDRGVWVHPGYFFGMPESGWLVVSLLGYEQEVSSGIANLIDYFRTNHAGNITA
jgi:alanine-synthesizing transaminase